MKVFIIATFLSVVSVSAVVVDKSVINACEVKVKDEILKSAGSSVADIKMGSHVYLDSKTNKWFIKTCFTGTVSASTLDQEEDQTVAGCDNREVVACQILEEIQFFGTYDPSKIPMY